MAASAEPTDRITPITHSRQPPENGCQESPPLRVGFIYQEGGGWAARQSFAKNFFSALNQANRFRNCTVDFITIENDQEPKNPRARGSALPASIWKQSESRRRFLSLEGFDAVIDLFAPPLPEPAAAVTQIGYIFDFQHMHLPEMFSETERESRDRGFQKRADFCDAVMVSSQTAANDYSLFAPEVSPKVSVHPFTSNLAGYRKWREDPKVVFAKYRLPEKFLLVANQFWRHKNHEIVIEAIAICRDRGITIPAVFTGLPLENRDPLNRPVSNALQSIASHGLGGQVVPLGMVPYQDLVSLMQCAALIAQPSRFEGWNTTVQDAKALNRPLICSEIPIHREQAPNALGFFDCDKPDEMATLLAEVWRDLPPGPDFAAERIGLENERNARERYGENLWETVTQSVLRKGREKIRGFLSETGN